MLNLEETLKLLLVKAYPLGRPTSMGLEDQRIHLTIALEQLRHERKDLCRIRGFVIEGGVLHTIVADDDGNVGTIPLMISMPPSSSW